MMEKTPLAIAVDEAIAKIRAALPPLNFSAAILEVTMGKKPERKARPPYLRLVRKEK